MNGSKEVQSEETEMTVIHAYSRAQAIEDGVLIDVGDMAKEAGFRYPVALTHAVWTKYVEVPRGVEGQDEVGRLWDILFMTHFAIKTSPRDASSVPVLLSVRNDNASPRRVELKSVVGPGDKGEPVITIMLPYED